MTIVEHFRNAAYVYMHYFTCPKWQLLNILGLQHKSTQLHLPQMATVEHFRNTAYMHQFHLPQMATVEHFRNAVSMHHFTCPKWQLLNTLGMQDTCIQFHLNTLGMQATCIQFYLPQMAAVEHFRNAVYAQFHQPQMAIVEYFRNAPYMNAVYAVSPAPNGNC